MKAGGPPDQHGRKRPSGVTRSRRRLLIQKALPTCNPGSIAHTLRIALGPGSAVHREVRCTASGTRDDSVASRLLARDERVECGHRLLRTHPFAEQMALLIDP